MQLLQTVPIRLAGVSFSGERMAVTLTAASTSNPPAAYSQAQIPRLFHVSDPSIKLLSLNSTIEERHLILPDKVRVIVSQGELLEKHRNWALRIGGDAIERCLGAVPARTQRCCIPLLRHFHRISSSGPESPAVE